ncbi:hypothetical protein PR048_019600 [Dryococelus australis]|uniref:C2H2-type domain-containing protein n=1 Tax=Dryococelus australis TaxID=614101 RepID=A0ABQ9H407_9NEOP|nr:hypothetical protein PR048_019600 [Dryococelus australis]
MKCCFVTEDNWLEEVVVIVNALHHVAGKFRASSDTVADQLDCSSPTKANWVQSPVGSLRLFARGNCAGRCCWSENLLGDLTILPPFHSGTALYSPHFTLIGFQDLDGRGSRSIGAVPALSFQLAILSAMLNAAPASPTDPFKSLPEPLCRHQCHFCDKTFTFGYGVRQHKRFNCAKIPVACHICVTGAVSSSAVATIYRVSPLRGNLWDKSVTERGNEGIQTTRPFKGLALTLYLDMQRPVKGKCISHQYINSRFTANRSLVTSLYVLKMRATYQKHLLASKLCAIFANDDVEATVESFESLERAVVRCTHHIIHLRPTMFHSIDSLPTVPSFSVQLSPALYKRVPVHQIVSVMCDACATVSTSVVQAGAASVVHAKVGQEVVPSDVPDRHGWSAHRMEEVSHNIAIRGDGRVSHRVPGWSEYQFSRQEDYHLGRWLNDPAVNESLLYQNFTASQGRCLAPTGRLRYFSLAGGDVKHNGVVNQPNAMPVGWAKNSYNLKKHQTSYHHVYRIPQTTQR